jgi:multimeric flavodoxin WrbA
MGYVGWEGLSMSQNIVLLSGSPRKNANTDKLAGAFVKGAEAADGAVV